MGPGLEHTSLPEVEAKSYTDIYSALDDVYEAVKHLCELDWQRIGETYQKAGSVVQTRHSFQTQAAALALLHLLPRVHAANLQQLNQYLLAPPPAASGCLSPAQLLDILDVLVRRTGGSPIKLLDCALLFRQHTSLGPKAYVRVSLRYTI